MVLSFSVCLYAVDFGVWVCCKLVSCDFEVRLISLIDEFAFLWTLCF